MTTEVRSKEKFIEGLRQGTVLQLPRDSRVTGAVIDYLAQLIPDDEMIYGVLQTESTLKAEWKTRDIQQGRVAASAFFAARRGVYSLAVGAGAGEREGVSLRLYPRPIRHVNVEILGEYEATAKIRFADETLTLSSDGGMPASMLTRFVQTVVGAEEAGR